LESVEKHALAPLKNVDRMGKKRSSVPSFQQRVNKDLVVMVFYCACVGK